MIIRNRYICSARSPPPLKGPRDVFTDKDTLVTAWRFVIKYEIYNKIWNNKMNTFDVLFLDKQEIHLPITTFRRRQALPCDIARFYFSWTEVFLFWVITRRKVVWNRSLGTIGPTRRKNSNTALSAKKKARYNIVYYSGQSKAFSWHLQVSQYLTPPPESLRSQSLPYAHSPDLKLAYSCSTQ